MTTRSGAAPLHRLAPAAGALLALVGLAPAPAEAQSGPAVSIADAQVEEGDTGITNVKFEVTLDKKASGNLTVDWETSDGTATAGTDYTAGSGTLDFDAGDASRTVSVTVLGDEEYEPDETFTVTLSNPSGATIGDGTATGTITNDDDLPATPIGEVLIGNTGKSDGGDAGVNSGGFPGQGFTTGNSSEGYNLSSVVLKIRSPDDDVTVTIRENDTGSNPGAVLYRLGNTPIDLGGGLYEYRAPPNTTLARRTRYHVVARRTGGGSARIWKEAGSTGADPGAKPGFALDGAYRIWLGSRWTSHSGSLKVQVRGSEIQPPPSLSIADARVDESDSGSATLDFAVTLDPVSTQTVTVDWATISGTATAGTDYTGGNGTLTIAPGDSTGTVSVAVLGDEVHEPDETFRVLLLNASGGATIGGDTATGTITDDDDPTVTLVLTPDTISENGGTSALSATLDAASSRDTVVTVSVSPVAPATASDYTLSPAGMLELRIPAGDTASDSVVTITGVDNSADAPRKTVTVSGAAANDWGIEGPRDVALTISDDENAEPTGAPTIDETAPEVGDTLTADTSGIGDADGLTSATYAFQWIRVASDGTQTPIPGATGETYTVSAADAGAKLKVRVTFSDEGGTQETVDSVATAEIPSGALPAVSVAPVADSVAEGADAQFTVERTVVTTGALTVGYRVSETGDMVASGEEGARTLDFGDGETEKTVTVPTVDDGAHEADSVVTLEMTATAEYTVETATAAVTVEDDDNAEPTGAPTIDDTTPVIGETLTAEASNLDDPDGLTNPSFTWQWIRVAGGTDTRISGATAPIYTVVAEDEGATLKVEVSFTDDAGTAEAVESAETTETTAVPRPTVSVAPVADSVTEGADARFALTRAEVTTGALTVHYRVSESGEMVAPGGEGAGAVHFGPGEIAKTVTVPTVDDGGHEADSTVTLELTARAAYIVETATAEVTVEDDDNAEPTGTPTIDDTTPAVGETLTAEASNLDDPDGLTNRSFTWQWIRVASDRTETRIGGATAASYTVVAGDEGAKLKVEASFTDDDGTAEAVESAETAAATAARPTVSAAPVADSVTEGADAQFTVTRAVITTGALTVDYSVSESGEMVAPGAEGARTLDFGDGETEKTVTVPTVDDGGHEADSTVTLELTVSAAYTVEIATAAVTVEDDDNAEPTGAPTIDDTTPVIGETLTADTSGISDPDGLTSPGFRYQWYRTVHGTATPIPGATDQTYPVVAADLGATLHVEVSYTDDDGNTEVVESAPTAVTTPAPLPSVSVASVASPVTEGAGAQFTLTRAEVTTGALTVRYRVSESGGVVASGDEGAKTLDFADGETAKTITVPTLNDGDNDGDATVTVTLTADPAYNLGAATAEVVVEDDEAPPRLSIADASVAEGDTGARSVTFTVVLNRAARERVTVDWRTSDGTASSGTDYTAASGSLTFDIGEERKTLAVSVTGDTEIEPDETFRVTLQNPVGATLRRAVATGTIRNDDSAAAPTPRLSIRDASVPEGDTGTSPLDFTVALNRAPTTPVTVRWTTADGTANAGTDYTAASGRLTFPVGEDQRTVSVPVRGDTEIEPDETFRVTLTGASGARLHRDTATGTIRNDDSSTVEVAAETATVTEGEDAVFVLTRAGALSQALEVAFRIEDADGVLAAPAPDGASFAAGAATARVTLPTGDDSDDEPDAQLKLTLVEGSGYDPGAAASATVTVEDDDLPVVTVAAETAEVREGEAAAFLLTRRGDLTAALTVELLVSEQGGDMVPATAEGARRADFAAGAATASLRVATTEDRAHEPDSRVTVAVSEGAGYAVGEPGSATVSVADSSRVSVLTPGRRGGASALLRRHADRFSQLTSDLTLGRLQARRAPVADARDDEAMAAVGVAGIAPDVEERPAAGVDREAPEAPAQPDPQLAPRAERGGRGPRNRRRPPARRRSGSGPAVRPRPERGGRRGRRGPARPPREPRDAADGPSAPTGAGSAWTARSRCACRASGSTTGVRRTGMATRPRRSKARIRRRRSISPGAASPPVAASV